MGSHLKSIVEMPRDALQKKVFAFDYDGTLSDERGGFDSHVVAQLERIQKLGIRVVMVTGRPAGWADAIVRMLPFDAVVAENGAVLFEWPCLRMHRSAHDRVRKRYWNELHQSWGDSIPQAARSALHTVLQESQQRFPQVRAASDQAYRLFDLAIDFAEEVSPALSYDQAFDIARIFEKHGAMAKVSHIHVNGWVGQFDKASGLNELLKGWSLQAASDLVYFGDSPNDGPLFEIAATSIGVANIKSFIESESQDSAKQGKVSQFSFPQYLTQHSYGEGVLEVLARIK